MSTQAAAFISPRSSSGSFLISVLIHGFFAVSLVAVLNIHPTAKAPVEEYVDLGYQTFDEPPAPAQEEKKVVHQEPVHSEIKAAPTNAPQEMQDEKGDVAGSQEAAKENKISADSNGSANATPYYRIKPKYPKAALATDTEGWVMMQIDITEAGEVDNIRVVDGEQRNMFQSEAKRAVSQWKYKPFVDGEGHPFRKRDHQVRVDFKLVDSRIE